MSPRRLTNRDAKRPGPSPRTAPVAAQRPKRPAPPQVSQRELVEASLLHCPPRRDAKRG